MSASGLEYTPVDLGSQIIPLGKIGRVFALNTVDARRYQATSAIMLDDGTTVYSTMSPESICRSMWNTITTCMRM